MHTSLASYDRYKYAGSDSRYAAIFKMGAVDSHCSGIPLLACLTPPVLYSALIVGNGRHGPPWSRFYTFRYPSLCQLDPLCIYLCLCAMLSLVLEGEGLVLNLLSCTHYLARTAKLSCCV